MAFAALAGRHARGCRHRPRCRLFHRPAPMTNDQFTKGASMTIATLDQSRSLRLKTLTTETHEALDSSIMAAAAFDSVEGYAGFAEVQYLFHRDIDALYDNPDLKTLIPDLELRSRDRKSTL